MWQNPLRYNPLRQNPILVLLALFRVWFLVHLLIIFIWFLWTHLERHSVTRTSFFHTVAHFWVKTWNPRESLKSMLCFQPVYPTLTCSRDSSVCFQLNFRRFNLAPLMYRLLVTVIKHGIAADLHILVHSSPSQETSNWGAVWLWISCKIFVVRYVLI